MQPGKNRGIFLTALCVILGASTPCVADDIYVNIKTDTNDGICGPFPCSLRDAVLTANAHPGPDTIHVPAGHYNLSIAGKGEDQAMTGDLDIRDDVRIVGSGSGTTLIDAQEIDRVFHIPFSSVDQIDGQFFDLTIRGGVTSGAPTPASGAGLYVDQETVVLTRCIVEGNVTTTNDGGGVGNSGGSVTFINSTIRGNHATSGAGVYSYEGSLTMYSSTVVDNLSLIDSYSAGAVYTKGANVGLTNSTFYDNHVLSTSWGGIGGLTFRGGQIKVDSCTVAENNGGAQIRSHPDHPAAITLVNTIVKGTCAGQTFNSLGGNVISGDGGYCGFSNDSKDYWFVPIYLLPLGDYGGHTPTAPLQWVINNGNLAIDNVWAAPNCRVDDQRSTVRPQDGDGDGQAVCDTGAVEVVFANELIFSNSFEDNSN